MDEIVKALGFADEREFHRLVCCVDLTSPEKVAAFKAWQDEDGTKAGLLALPQSAYPNVVRMEAKR